MTALDVSAYVGLLAVFLATVNISLGLLIAVRYSPWRLWPHRRINIFAIHNWTAYLLVVSVLTHPVILLFSTTTHWRLVDVAFPVLSPVQPIENTIGVVGLYAVAVVVLTSYFRIQLGRRRWKQFHYLVYGAAVCVFIHSILSDPRLKGVAIDPFDGEKLFVESCLLIVVLTAAWAWLYRLHKDRKEQALGIGRYRVLRVNEGD
jgi:predicted ferric reductase